jgi:hypothetical protein
VFDLIDKAPAIAALERDFMISADQVTHFSRDKNAADHDMLSAKRNQHVQIVQWHGRNSAE